MTVPTIDETVAKEAEVNPHWGTEVDDGGLLWCWHCGDHFRKPGCEEGVWHHVSELSVVDGSCPCERARMAEELEARRLVEEANGSTSPSSNGNGHHHPAKQRRSGDLPGQRRSNRPSCQGSNGYRR